MTNAQEATMASETREATLEQAEEYLTGRPLLDLANWIHEHGPVRCVRVSSAQARGNAKNYPYWGAVRYSVRLTIGGSLTFAAEERATSDRRSEDKADDDARYIADAEDRCYVTFGLPGPVGVVMAETVLDWLRGNR